MNFLNNMVLIEQCFTHKGLPSVEEAVKQSLGEAGLNRLLRPGSRVAITAGSRGIKNIAGILKAIAGCVLSHGASPCLLAAMGSHGGGTAAGQLAILESLGITEEQMGCSVLASDRSVAITGEDGRSFLVNSLALDFEHIIVVNRIKPHTSFHGPFESGLLKMLAVGMGGPEGASQIHARGAQGLPETIPRVARSILNVLPIALGVAILEDSFENTMQIRAVPPSLMEITERELLTEARRVIPGIPFEEIDLLVVDEIGKNFSGTGMDTNVIGRLRIQGMPEPAAPSIKRIVALGLSGHCHGNAYGIGLADFTTRRLARAIDFRAMHLNALTSTFTQRAMLPMVFPDDLSAINAAVKSLGKINPGHLRVVRIKNTLQLDKMLVSPPLAVEAGGNKALHIVQSPFPVAFGPGNTINPF